MDANGNPTLAEYVTMAKGISAMNANGRQKKYYDAAQDLVDQHGSVEGVIQNVDPSSLDQYQLHAYKSFADNYTGATEAKDKVNVKSAVEAQLDGIGQTGDVFKFYEGWTPKTEADLQASVQIREKLAQNAGFQKQLYANRKGLADAKANELMSVLKGAEESLAGGDVDTAGRLMEGASRSMPTRRMYKYDGKGGMVEMHMSREEGYVPTGRVLPVQAMMGEARKLGAQQYSDIFATEMRATSQFNRDNINKGGAEGTDAEGNKYKIYTQIRGGSLSQRDYLVFKDGKQVAAFDSPEKLREAGISFRNVEAEQADANLEKTKQATATSAMAADAHKADRDATRATMPQKVAKANADLTKALQDVEKGDLEAGRKALDDLLMPFKKGSSLTMNEGKDGVLSLTSEGHNALTAAQDYIKAAEAGGQHDPAALADARAALALHSKIAGQHSGKYNLGPSRDERAEVDKIKGLVKQFGKDRAREIYEKEKGMNGLSTGIIRSR